jgi:hypothetical protein
MRNSLLLLAEGHLSLGGTLDLLGPGLEFLARLATSLSLYEDASLK